MEPRKVYVSVTANDEAEFAELFEKLGRICAGLILEGKDAVVASFPADDDEE